MVAAVDRVGATAPKHNITVRLEKDGSDLIKVVWRDRYGSAWPPYCLERAWLLKKVKLAREALEALTAGYRKQLPDYSGAIAQLADAGRALRLALFRDFRPEYAAAAEDAERWFVDTVANSVEPVEITVFADPAAPIPWGVLYEPMGSGANADVHDEFWALKFRVAALYNGMKPARLEVSRLTGDMRLLSAINQEAFSSAHNLLELTQQEYISKFLERPVGTAHSKKGCQTRWKQVGESDCLIYFYGHGTGGEIFLAANDKITPAGFRDIFRRERFGLLGRNQPYVLTVLNGCSTVSGVDSESFMLATADPGFCGYIGAEAEIPDRFALMFGQELLHLLLAEGVQLRDAMARLWRKHKPMALLYGCYAHPQFSVEQDASRAPLPPEYNVPNYQPASA